MRPYWDDGGCPFCGAQTQESRICDGCEAALSLACLTEEGNLPRLRRLSEEDASDTELVCRSLYAYEYDVVKRLLFYLKRYPDKRVVTHFAERLCGILPETWKTEGTLYVSIPRSSQGLRKYGFDQGKLLAKTLVRLLGEGNDRRVRYADVLARRPFGRVQKKLTAVERMKNQRGRFYVRALRLPWEPERIVITDDVITTGASVLSAAKALRECFPKAEIFALSLAAVV